MTLRLLLDKGVITQKEYDKILHGALPEHERPGSSPVVVTSKWSASLYGFAEFDSMWDSTESFNEQPANGAIARPGTATTPSYAGDHGRMQFSLRNSRLGFKLDTPTFHGITVKALVEADFLGNQPPTVTQLNPGGLSGGVSEYNFYVSPTFRLRHYYLKLENDYVDVLFGQYWELFGWQSFFHPNTVEIQGVPGQVYSRSPQVRLSHGFKTSAVDVDVAVAAVRPPQRDSWTPDGQAGLRLSINQLKGMHTAGASNTNVVAGAIGVSGTLRHFEVPQLVAAPTTAGGINGWAISADALLPIIPASPEKRGNSLTVQGSYQYGYGFSDLYSGLTGGVVIPTALPGGKTYNQDIDNGLVGFNSTANSFDAVNWQSFLVGLEYYLPPKGNVWVSGNFSQMNSNNIGTLGTKTKIFDQSRWADANLFWDVVPSVRLGAEYAWFQQHYVDGAMATNHRVQFSAFYLF
jgi:hypothetical protein